ncbi:serologically defined colon cancer antigen 1 [Arthroderma uncinatum]|uniref:serologically defined colon cancer antigen 1 n=1 Tax=Arthroderma uncinatum TaxID=74035 RepID=UPI00144A69ED|nr:serologically defined colon cancer antigen 1 [Arthroderma uncinatum]KAF3480336.1 serologically defined colon cancer antigen 1 [Arthroderma uncinatum]
MKQRYSSLDVKVISRELSASILGLRIANIYDLSPRTFLFKLALPDIKKQLIINAGFHCHLTESSRTTADAPSHFVSRLRKFLKTRRITGVRQIGTDRILEFEISDGLFRLYLEFFAAGNLILTDAKYEIVALLRHVAPGSDIEEVKVGMSYRLESKMNYNGIPPLTVDRLKVALGKDNGSKVLKRSLYFGFPEYPPTLLDHAFHVVGFDSKLQPAQILTETTLINRLMDVLHEADRVNNALSSDRQHPGYIIAKNTAPGSSDGANGSKSAPVIEFREFHPFEPSQSKDVPNTTTLHFENFNSAVDKYFSSIEARKLESRLTEREDTARKKLEATKRDHEKRVTALQEKQEFHVRKAHAIEANLSQVEEAINAVNGLVAQGMDWVEIASIDIDLGISPWANARQYYDEKKIAAVKEEKTLQASTKAIKSTEKKVNANLKHALKQEKPVLRRTRTPAWFEKFFFFISSDGYLVIGGRDPQQGEILFQRYLRKGDIYVHTDLEGGVPLIVKNKPETPDDPIPPNTISQASTYSVASSKAWDTKAAMGGWWVHAAQVSKMTSTGDILKAGHFMIKGEKNHLPPGQTVLGFAVLFEISTRSVQNHTKFQLATSEGLETNDQSTSNTSGVPQVDPDQSDHQDDVTQERADTLASNLSEGEEEENGMEDISVEESTRAVQLGEKYDANVRQEESQEGGEQAAPQVEKQAASKITLNEDEVEDPSDQSEDETQPSTPSPAQDSPLSTPSLISSAGTQKSKPPIRGKRGKAKKLATKYKDQDEEDRKLALRLLGSAPETSTANKTKTKADIEAEREAQKERRRAQHERALQAVKRQQEAFARHPTEDGSGEDHKIDLSLLPTLVGTPVEGDDIEAAIPVCAPWSALGQYKYRAKLQPGKIKKGKAVKDILGKWIHDATVLQTRSTGKKPAPTDNSESVEDATEEAAENTEDANHILSMELDCIKAWREVEVMNTLPVGGFTIVSVAGAGGSSSGGVGPKGADSKGKGKGKKSGGGKGGKGGKKK